jgi:hypothetical protein
MHDAAEFEDAALLEGAAKGALFKVKTRIGLEDFDRALHEHEAFIAKSRETLPERLALYRDIRKRFSHLVENLQPPKDDPNE